MASLAIAAARSTTRPAKAPSGFEEAAGIQHLVRYTGGASPADEEPSIDGLSPSFDEVMRLYRTPPFETRFVLRYSPSACE